MGQFFSPTKFEDIEDRYWETLSHSPWVVVDSRTHEVVARDMTRDIAIKFATMDKNYLVVQDMGNAIEKSIQEYYEKNYNHIL